MTHSNTHQIQPLRVTKLSSTGVMVSPGRMVNLSGAPLTLEQKMRKSIDQAMRAAKFTQHNLRCENLILEALMQARQYRSRPHHSYQGKKVTRLSFGTSRPNNRNQELIRIYLLGMLWYCWVLGTNKKPKVNNRHNPDTPFVVFVKTLGAWFGLGNIVKNLERYQSYRKRTQISCINVFAI
jgi:hypothetical protein